MKYLLPSASSPKVSFRRKQTQETMAEEIKLIEPAEWQLKVPEQSENDA